MLYACIHAMLENPDVELLDTQRHFTDKERYAIYVLGGQQYAVYQKEIPDAKDMEADHQAMEIWRVNHSKKWPLSMPRL